MEVASRALQDGERRLDALDLIKEGFNLCNHNPTSTLTLTLTPTLPLPLTLTRRASTSRASCSPLSCRRAR
eukprot:scaffold50086_cov65-Phaeocystis_antarctica.AAC.1